jgi:hypothetical protein
VKDCPEKNMVAPFEALRILSLARGAMLHSFLLSCLGKSFSLHPTFIRKSSFPHRVLLPKDSIPVSLRPWEVMAVIFSRMDLTQFNMYF